MTDPSPRSSTELYLLSHARASAGRVRHLGQGGRPAEAATVLVPLADADEIRTRLEKQVDLIIDAGRCGIDRTTVINLTSVEPELVRAGQGPLEPFGLDG